MASLPDFYTVSADHACAHCFESKQVDCLRFRTRTAGTAPEERGRLDWGTLISRFNFNSKVAAIISGEFARQLATIAA
jgi:hypothetical protein